MTPTNDSASPEAPSKLRLASIATAGVAAIALTWALTSSTNPDDKIKPVIPTQTVWDLVENPHRQVALYLDATYDAAIAHALARPQDDVTVATNNREEVSRGTKRDTAPYVKTMEASSQELLSILKPGKTDFLVYPFSYQGTLGQEALNNLLTAGKLVGKGGIFVVQINGSDSVPTQLLDAIRGEFNHVEVEEKNGISLIRASNSSSQETANSHKPSAELTYNYKRNDA